MIVEPVIKIYDSVIDQIKKEIERTNNAEVGEKLKKQQQSYVAGLELALQIVEYEQEFVYGNEYAYEKLDETLQSYLDFDTTDLDRDEYIELLEEYLEKASDDF